VRHAEALLFVDDHQPQVFERHILLQKAVRADNDIDPPPEEVRQRFFDFGRTPEAVERFHANGKIRQPTRKRREMLLGQNRGRRQKRRLFAVHRRPERRAQRDFRLAESRIAANQAVHRFDVVHVGVDVFNGPRLIGGFLVFKRRAEFLIDAIGRQEGFALHRLARRINRHQLLGHVADGLFDPFLDRVPGGPSHLFNFRRIAVRPQIALNLLQSVHGQIELVAVQILDDQKIIFHGAHGDFLQPAVQPDAEIPVDHKIPFFQIAEGF